MLIDNRILEEHPVFSSTQQKCAHTLEMMETGTLVLISWIASVVIRYLRTYLIQSITSKENVLIRLKALILFAPREESFAVYIIVLKKEIFQIK